MIIKNDEAERRLKVCRERRAQLEKQKEHPQTESDEKILDNNTPDLLDQRKLHPGGGSGYELTPAQRAEIGAVGNLKGSKAAAEEYGVSDNHVRSNLMQGRHRGDVKAGEEERAVDVKGLIREKAEDLVSSALSQVDLTEVHGPMNNVTIAEKLTNIINRLSPRDGGDGGGFTNKGLVIYSVNRREEKGYEVIDV